MANTLAQQVYDFIRTEHHMAWEIPLHLDCSCGGWRGVDPAGHAEHVASMAGEFIRELTKTQSGRTLL